MSYENTILGTWENHHHGSGRSPDHSLLKQAPPIPSPASRRGALGSATPGILGSQNQIKTHQQPVLVKREDVRAALEITRRHTDKPRLPNVVLERQ